MADVLTSALYACCTAGNMIARWIEMLELRETLDASGVASTQYRIAVGDRPSATSGSPPTSPAKLAFHIVSLPETMTFEKLRPAREHRAEARTNYLACAGPVRCETGQEYAGRNEPVSA